MEGESAAKRTESPLEWSNADRSLLVLLSHWPVFLVYLILVTYFRNHFTGGKPEFAGATSLAWAALVVCFFAWTLLTVLAWWARSRKPGLKWFFYPAVQIYVLFIVSLAYFAGPLQSPLWVSTLAWTVVGLRLFSHKPLIAGAFSYLLWKCTALWLALSGTLPGVPFLRLAMTPQSSTEQHFVWAWFAATAVSAMFLVVIAGYLFYQYRKREREWLGAQESLADGWRQLSQAKAEWEATADSLTELLLLVSQPGMIIRGNRAAAQWAGCNVHDLPGKHYHELLHPDCQDEQCYLQTHWKRLWNGEPDPKIVNLEQTDIHLQRRIYATLRRIENPEKENLRNSEMLGLILLQDVSRQRVFEEYVRQSQGMDALGELAAGIAHEFNNELTVIQANAKMLSQSLDLEEDDVEVLDDIIESAAASTRLTRQLLLIGRSPRNLWTTMDLGEIVTRFSEVLRRATDQFLDIRVSEPEEEHLIRCDANQIRQALMVLAFNAKDSGSKRGALALNIEEQWLGSPLIHQHGVVPPGAYVVLTARHRGPPLPPEAMPKLFDPFAIPAGVRPGGKVGLAVVAGIVRQHEGVILCDSDAANGTVFRIYFPVGETAYSEDRERLS